MAIIRVTKEFSFEMSHALKNYNGACKNIHGHSYKLFVTVIGTLSTAPDDPKIGMLIDFGDLKKIVTERIVKVFDHAFVLNNQEELSCNASLHEMFSNTIYVPYQPTCENLVADFAQRIESFLPAQAKLFSVKLYETATSFAEWFASDNNR
ncbi:MAG TPA: 6-carboxytetrahydropterin synthase QueD [Marinilabiliales bacterium]|jgi:6-pyruvoyltetrahydropterin/6-carboxytetrahydropterin synthase|nr:MAG: 6-carboxytetrahydropterin synthase QueD [Bacteroidetes bacterium GWA2_40_14]OFX57681.1 MAG: 6-carboxytetrahydropterin synthase QueD [Bacteroidetes bacterium GWC2_40_13]OFX75880.1 MAG: 6-carboxytetrahydropterin synthase QueD [Bacteroidetes bacterium GWD2_40_43]OFX88618.1 MAG: 6-carboxytetrahydropterin synthase QueD [Bacteroidetes bacterium GWE2_40_63]OFY20346.1 MAG: 6-carboxytetrahydropterin synthase QueD [Bacteroidetes bacterium GWF2_40_13]OFZ24733.1 MAG: 6-carboxytetrahydropterin synt